MRKRGDKVKISAHYDNFFQRKTFMNNYVNYDNFCSFPAPQVPINFPSFNYNF